MKNIYFVIVDTTKPNDTAEFAFFMSKGCMNDFAGCLTQIARANKTSIDDLRMYVYPTQKAWNDDFCRFVERYRLRMKAELNGLTIEQQRALNDLCNIIETECA